MKHLAFAALLLGACAPAMTAVDAANVPDATGPDAASCDPTACDRDCLASGSSAGVCRAAGCECVGGQDAAADAAYCPLAVCVQNCQGAGYSTGECRATGCACVGEPDAATGLEGGRDVVVGHDAGADAAAPDSGVDPLASNYTTNEVHPLYSECGDPVTAAPTAGPLGASGCSVDTHNTLSFYVAASRDLLVAIPLGGSTGLVQTDGTSRSCPSQCATRVDRSRDYFVGATHYGNFIVHVSAPSTASACPVAGIPGRTATAAEGEFVLLGCRYQ